MASIIHVVLLSSLHIVLNEQTAHVIKERAPGSSKIPDGRMMLPTYQFVIVERNNDATLPSGFFISSKASPPKKRYMKPTIAPTKITLRANVKILAI
ncbi:hypothetical protein KBAD11_28350 [Aeromonas dhakensis]|nr:hypothetical protein KBAD45_27710 [Aeromonas dhakensis]CAD7512271.1 hypothetical protein KBAD50_14800 [Aeromonas dhakensis]CAD7512583.1 hypothetical protein KBAD49_14810 [Aeromonas dhakensis]CAD7517861.1 hypothetical protein KBAD59_28400 [Aeromonas dhakensis]CAD7518727.1 hypothetical protein KBAD11_28350 [Aeromonas dhakensis]